MPADDRSLGALAPVVRAFVQRHRIPADSIRPDGRLVLTVDERYRIQLLPSPHGRVALQSELLVLPDAPDRRMDETLLKLAKVASGLLQRNASTLCIDRKRQALVLQQSIEAGANVGELQDALAQFTNALAFWSRLCVREADAPRGALT